MHNYLPLDGRVLYVYHICHQAVINQLIFIASQCWLGIDSSHQALKFTKYINIFLKSFFYLFDLKEGTYHFGFEEHWGQTWQTFNLQENGEGWEFHN